MALLKCKMCGGDLEVKSGVTVAECEYCGTRQTLPKVSEEVIHTLFNRANALRLKCEFDKAEQIYEKILQENDAESEAHWGIVLCKYGIEYVEDPKTYKRIPTCHRTSYDAVTADGDYLAALQHADAAQRSLYEAEAKAIDEIQRSILAIVKEEKPFDVFLCYKETDESGKRTVDSAIANDIYYQLTQEGLKVFYSAITLEDKLGREYEPYIFAALNSAKVMLVIGTQPQYFTAVWVKNEWSRFMKLMKTDRSKLLIPCYKDMDAYELPEEFAHLQAQDMGKIGFINDVVRGIKKVTVKDEPLASAVPQAAAPAATNANPLLKRAFMFLEDGDWARADEFCEQVLNTDPECAEAYLGKMMAELKVRSRAALSEQAMPFDNNLNYKKVLRFGDEALKNELTGAVRAIHQRAERTRLMGIYKKADTMATAARTKGDYLGAAELFDSIGDFEDAAQRAEQCREKYQEVHFGGLYSGAVALMNSAKSEEDFTKAEKVFAQIKGYKDSAQLAEDCGKKSKYARQNAIYTAAVALMSGNRISNYKKAIAKFALVRDFRDAEDMIGKCNDRIEALRTEPSAAALKKQERVLLIVVIILLVGIIATAVYIGVNLIGSAEKPAPTEPTTTEVPVIALEDLKWTINDDGTVTITEFTHVPPDEDNDGYYDVVDEVWAIPAEIEGKPVTAIGEDAFRGVYFVKSFYLPASVTSMGDNAFCPCYAAIYVDEANPDYSSDEYGVLFNKDKTTLLHAPMWLEGHYRIPDGVTAIAESAFYMSEMTGVTIPEGVTEIGMGAFLACMNVTEFTFPSSLTHIYRETYNFPSLTKMTFGDQIPTFDAGAFLSSCLPKDVIVSVATQEHADLLRSAFVEGTQFEVRNPEPPVTEPPVTEPPIVTPPVTEPPIVLPPVTSADLISGDFQCTTSPDGTLTITKYTGSATDLIIPSQIEGYRVTEIGADAFWFCTSLVSVTIPDGVTYIGFGAFGSCSNLTNVSIPDSITEIGNYSFQLCKNLTNVTIPSSVTRIGELAFAECSSLTGIWVDGNNRMYSSDERGVLFNKSKTQLIQAPGMLTGDYQIPNSVTNIAEEAFRDCDNITSVTIPHGVTNIGYLTFYDCAKLANIVIPNSVTQIGHGAFRGCKSLASITIPDSVTSIGEDAFRESGVMTVYHSANILDMISKNMGCFPDECVFIIK